MQMNIKIFNEEDIEVVKMDKIEFEGKVAKGWGMYVEGFGYMAFKGNAYPYVIAGKKWMTAVKYGWKFDWDYEFVQAD